MKQVYFITAETRQDRTYKADQDQSQANSHWIESFKCELLGLLFCKFMAEDAQRPHHWLMTGPLTPTDAPLEPINVAPSRPPTPVQDWEALFYLILYLVPHQDVGRLMTQFSKAVALDDKTPKPPQDADKVARLRDLCLTYTQMAGEHAVTALEAPNFLQDFRDLFTDPADFDRVFRGHEPAPDQPVTVTAEVESKRLEGVQTGLRHISRFGTPHLLKSMFGDQRIKTQEVETYLAGLETIAEDHKRAAKQHEALVRLNEQRQKIADRQIREYKATIDKIDRFKTVAERVRLSGFVGQHILTMRLVARLVDFSATWERDRMFVALALYASHLEDEDWPRNVAAFAKKVINAKSSKAILGLLKDKGVGAESLEYFCRHFGERKAEIRNALAHFAVLKPDFQLTEQINQVRDLMGYDRKLKNAVSKAMKDILLDAGFDVTWHVHDHQLRAPTKAGTGVRSARMTHLSFLSGQNKGQRFSQDRTSHARRIAVANLVFGAGNHALASPPSNHKSKAQRHNPRAQRPTTRKQNPRQKARNRANRRTRLP